ncbi:Cna B-type domain-containing protein [Collinsella ihumii]|uniref:Cna B-type domain-containing protein n=1 Tax=Collinsella ihumii TaxID=1720204 RepID=UPI0025AA630D|nr:Cna B-type domain-containing protein [Collinsella ihumii]MDN0055811.1 Cna B-type domain-containing protein [Collinsella ihumii]
MLSALRPQSLILESSLDAPMTVNASAACAGGFAGAMANSYAVNVDFKGSGAITAKNNAGGFAGSASVGWGIELGSEDKSNTSLLGNLAGLVASLLTGEWADKGGDLLSLAGVKPSALLGTNLEASLTVTAGDSYAGGMIGDGAATTIASSDAGHINELSFWRYATKEHPAPSMPKERKTNMEGVSSVNAGNACAGGIAGSVRPASVAAVLNSAVGVLDEAVPFEITDVSLTGPLAVSAKEYYAGGAVAYATGGDITNVVLNGITSVSAKGNAGGFIGFSGPGGAANTSGLNILGLIKLSGLLSVAEYSAVTVQSCSVSGQSTGFAVKATGKNDAAETNMFAAGGFFGQSNSTTSVDCHVYKLASVSADNSGIAGGVAGGFVGYSTTGGLAEALDGEGEASTILSDLIKNGLLNVNNLLGAIPYLVPTYQGTSVSFTNGGCVTADIAGGFAGDFQSGEVNEFTEDDLKDTTLASIAQSVKESPYAVINISKVEGGAYAGGFGGRVEAGSLADAADGGISILGSLANVKITDLVNLIQAYVPYINYAGVHSNEGTYADDAGTQPADDKLCGFTVHANRKDDADSSSGSAGGFIGYGAAVQVSYCSVDQLFHTEVSEPADLEGTNGDTYFAIGNGEGKSEYAIRAPRYAGGYIGHLDIGSTAGVGSGLELLKETGLEINLSDLVSALNVMASTLEHSNVYGATGGYAVLADGTDNNGSIGHAGGFAGKISGGQIQDCSSYNFSYIIGQIAAGGYAGEIEPGSVAKVLGEAAGNEGGLLDGLLGTDNLATLVQSFVPVIRNSETTCVPCGGAVRAQALTTEEGGADGSDTKVTVQRGMAGGYVGHSVGGQIWGNSSSSWKDEVDDVGNYTGAKREAAAIRIRSVYGAEYAGGFTGLMESGDTASAGGLNLLWGLVTVKNLLSALSVVYPTEENTAVYGPLRGLSAEEWNSWVDYVGIHGGYGSSLAGAAGKVDPNATDDEVAAKLSEYVYGTHVVAGCQTYESVAAGGGAAGGYVGSMVTGTITNGKAYDTKLVRAMRAAGGFAGAAEAGAAATLGSVGLANGLLQINLNELLNAAQIFVPAIKNSSVEGYRLGMTVESFGSGSRSDDVNNATGNAGGYIGYGAGAQIWGDGSTASEGESVAEAARGCNVSGLRRVRAAAYAGGFAGKLTAGAAAKLNTDNASDGFLQQVLDALVGSTGLNDLVSVLKLSMSVVRGTTVTGFDEAWGYTVESYRDGSYPIAAGGYAGAVEATVLGKLNQDKDALTANHVEHLRGVDGGYYAGGFVGLADVGGVADVASGSTEGSNVSILGLVGLNNVGVLQVFQPCIYGAGVIGVSDGITVRAHSADSGSILNNKRSSGNAGGFAGSVMSGTVQDSSVANLNSVSGPSYTGGFIGYTGKSGVLDAEEADIASILGLSAEVINLFSTIVKNDTVTGIAAGYTVSSSRDALSDEEDSASDVQPISGGFIGFADLAHVTGCSAINLKRVGSDEIAGGFAGKTTFDYLVKLETNSPLVAGLLVAVNAIVEALRLDELQNLDVIKINLGGEKVIEVGVLAEGNVAKISLFGLTIRIALSKESGPNREDVVTITIGDSSVELTCDKEGNISKEDISNLTVNLIKGNRSELDQCKVSGIADGYDVFGGGSQQDVDITETDAGFANGYAGGFVGLNDEGKLTNCEMLYADVIKGAASKTGPFSGQTHFESSYWFLTVDKLESDNTYHVYRANEDFLNKGVEGVVNGSMTVSVGTKDEADWTRFDVTGHRPLENASNHTDWTYAYITVPNSVAESPNGDGADEGEAEEAAQQIPLGVYASASKAILMDDTAVTDNTGGLTPEPGDGQDPCEASIDLTLQKVWNDGVFGLIRPNEIEFVVYATYTDENNSQITMYYDPVKNVLVNESELEKDPEDNLIKPTVTVTKEDAESLWSSTWRKVIENLPVATEDGHYYTYHVEEIEVPGYDTSIGKPDDKEQVIKVTNTFKGMPVLPGTGGTGTAFIMAAGLITLVVGGIWLDRQRRRRAAAQAVWRPTGTHFRD